MKRPELIEKLKEFGFEYSSTNYYGMGEEVWYKHPSGASINIDDQLDHSPAYLQRKLDIAPHKIRIHEFEQLAAAKAKEYAEAKGLVTARNYYLCCYNVYEDNEEMDWGFRINSSMFGTTLEYKRGKDFLPDEYAKVADSFRKFQTQ